MVNGNIAGFATKLFQGSLTALLLLAACAGHAEIVPTGYEARIVMSNEGSGALCFTRIASVSAGVLFHAMVDHGSQMTYTNPQDIETFQMLSLLRHPDSRIDDCDTTVNDIAVETLNMNSQSRDQRDFSYSTCVSITVIYEYEIEGLGEHFLDGLSVGSDRGVNFCQNGSSPWRPSVILVRREKN